MPRRWTCPTGPESAVSRPDRSTGRGLAIETLFEAPESAATSVRGGALPHGLAARYGPRLEIPLRPDRPTVIANFVTSLDGVVALGEDSSGGGEISGFFEPDRFIMGLLRTLADAILIGAGTLGATANHVWTAGRVNPASTDSYAAWRTQLGLSQPQPTTVIVTGSGRLNVRHPALTDPRVPVVLLTTPAGAAVLHSEPMGENVQLAVAGTGPRLTAAVIIDALAGLGIRLALCEGGPHLLGDLVAAERLDELFLTEAPQLLGRDEQQRRLSLVQGFAAGPGGGRWAELRSVRRAADHLFLRYRLRPR